MADGDPSWQRVRHRRFLAHRDTFRREFRALSRKSEPDWRTEPDIWVIWKSHQLQKALPPELRAHITMSAGIMRMPNGELRPVISRSGRTHGLHEPVYALRGDAEIAHDGLDHNGEPTVDRDKTAHAEVRMLEHAEREGGTLIMAAAGIPVCGMCVNRLDAANVGIQSRLDKPLQDRPNLTDHENRPVGQPPLNAAPPSSDQSPDRETSLRTSRPPTPEPPRRTPPNQPPPNQPRQGGRRRGPRQ